MCRRGVSRVTFKAQLKVGWWPKYYIDVLYRNVCHTPKFMNLPGYSGQCWCGLRNPRRRPRWPPEINARGCCVRIGVLIWCILFHQINDIYFCSVGLNFLMVHLNMVSISRSRSNSRSNTKISKKMANFNIIFCYCTKVYLNRKKCYM